MFTGLVEAVGELVERKPTSGGFRLRIASSLAREVVQGDSLAVNGVCLTVILAENTEIHADVGPETIRATTLGMLSRGCLVNLERPLRVDGLFDAGEVARARTRPFGDRKSFHVGFQCVTSPGRVDAKFRPASSAARTTYLPTMSHSRLTRSRT